MSARLRRGGGASSTRTPARMRMMPWRQLIAGCIVSTRCSCVCPYDATRPVDGTQLAASGGLGPVPRKLFCDIGPHARRRVAWPCPRFPLHRAHSACMACSYACPYDATRRVDNAQLAASCGLGPVPQMLMHAAGRTYPAVSSWRISGKRCSCADSRDAMEAARSWLHRGHVLLLCMSV